MSEDKAALIVLVAVAFIFAAIFVPIVMSLSTNANMTDWSLPVKIAFTVLVPIIFLFGIAISFIPKGRKTR
jgi:hypothetical protein